MSRLVAVIGIVLILAGVVINPVVPLLEIAAQPCGFTYLVTGRSVQFDVVRGFCDNQYGDPPYTFAWEFGDGASAPATNESRMTHSYAADGSYAVILTVTDSRTVHYDPALRETVPGPFVSTWAQNVVVTPAAAAAFKVSFTWSADATTVTFDSTVSEGTAPYTYYWTFGDQAVSELADPVHIYLPPTMDPTSYPVRLTVTDAKGVKVSVQSDVLADIKDGPGPGGSDGTVDDAGEAEIETAVPLKPIAWRLPASISLVAIGLALVVLRRRF